MLKAPDRYDPDDEIVIHNLKTFHLERMSNHGVWIGLSLKDGRTLHVNIGMNENCRHKVRMVVEMDP